MSSLRLTLCTGVLAAATLTPTAYVPGTAYAADGGVSVEPAAPAPGTDIALRVTDCPGSTAVAASAAFVADARLTGSGGTLTGETRIRTSLEAGVYAVKVTCGGDVRHSSDLTVGTPAKAPATPTAHASPVAPVSAGGGGTARLATVDESRTGPGTAHTVTGLVLAGIAAVAVALRSARRSRGTD
ncbi:hypothetical protein [Streptomyces sp. B93]|uniref:hypothetical protein n=1 Tax=Streptomyces sp. B93 TaxID=2824875 RepID=UPI001B3869C6|nr:hypothetical protein [Streptomyces sp. B93]MBQ1090599.1 hypothetical protein [Streptomyces sp. B93]